jgi:hypothetical protein
MWSIWSLLEVAVANKVAVVLVVCLLASQA